MEYPNRSDSIVYFDTAGRSVLPASVEAAGLKAIQQKSQPWSGVGSESDIEDVRHMFADLIGCTDSRCIALNPSTGFAMSLVAKNVVDNGILTIDKKVILLDKEMGSVVYPWQDACKKVGARIKIVQDPLLTHSVGLSWTDAVVAAIDESVAVVALPAVHWCNGAKINLKDVATALLKYPKATRPLLVVDGTQSIGAQAFNVCEIDAAFVACSVHKWLNCPYGMSLVYIHPAYHSTWLPLDQHERGRVGSNEEGWDEVIFMDKETGFYPSALFPDARRFDAGGKPNPVTIPMVRAGLHTVLKWGPAFVESRTAVLTDSITKQLCDLYAGNVIVRPKEGRSAHIFGIRFHPQSLLHSSVPLMTLNAELKKNGVYASVRGEWLRISVYLFNTAGEVNRFVSIFVHIVRAMVSVNAPLDTKRDTTKRVLVTGAAGWLGQFVTHSLLNTISPVPLYNIANNKDNEDKGGITSNDGDDAIPRIVQHQHLDVFAAYSRAVPHWVPETRRVHLDLSDTASVRSAIETVRPDIIIHTAALSAPMVCHKDARDAYAVNSPVALIDVVQELVPECLFLFTSTDMVYDGEHAPYKPTALNSNTSAADPTPVNVYGETKLAFERQVLRLKYGTVLRLSNMIGPPCTYIPAGTKFLEWVHTAFTKREYVGLKAQEIRSFVHVQDVVRVILTLMQRYCQGDRDIWSTNNSDNETVCASSGESTSTGTRTRIFNVGGPQPLSRLDVARSLCTALGSQLEVVDSANAASAYVSAPGTGASASGVTAISLLAGSGDNRCDKDCAPLPTWKVYVMDSPTDTAQQAPAAVAVAVGALRSPRDIRMDSSGTEEVLGFKFATVESILLASLHIV